MIMRGLAVLAIAMLGASSGASAGDYAVASWGAGHHQGHGSAALPACEPADPWFVVAPEPLPLLIGPGFDYQPLAVVPPCQRLSIVTCEYRSGWCKVRYGRHDGWVFERWRRTFSHYFLGH